MWPKRQARLRTLPDFVDIKTYVHQQAMQKQTKAVPAKDWSASLAFCTSTARASGTGQPAHGGSRRANFGPVHPVCGSDVGPWLFPDSQGWH